MKWRAAGALLCASLAIASGGWAAEDKRKLPDYGNRGDPSTTFGDVAIWVPRILLSPVYLVTEYGIRWPLGHAIAAAERAHVPRILYDFFFFGPDHRAGFAPVGFVDFGFRPSVGLYAFWDDAFFQGNDLRFHGTTGGANWFAGVFTDRILFHEKDSLDLTLLGIERPDHAFFGIGPDTLQGNISRYGEDQLEASAAFEFPLWRSSRVETGVGVRSIDFHRGYFRHDPSIEQEVATGAYPLPDGFAQGYTAQTNHLLLALDSRRPSPADGSGFRVEADADQGTDVRRVGGGSWLRYGASAGGFLDLNGRNRVVSLSVEALFADSLNKRPIPFTERVTLGGSGPMRGFYPGRLRDRSAAVATLKYRWPIWVWLDGSLQASVGNVFGEHLQQFEVSRFRFSSAIGLESVGSRDGSVELLFGVGTETFDHGAQLDSARILIGTNRGF
jgi:Omp85 superfamily domain